MTGGIVSKGMLYLTLGLTVTTGVFALLGAMQFRGNINFGNSGGSSSERDAIIAVVTSLGGALLILGVILYPLFKRKSTKETSDE